MNLLPLGFILIIFVSSFPHFAPLQAFVCRELSSDMDMNLYNKLIVMMQQPKFVQYFDSGAVMGMGLVQ
jgi:hypothetical protein